MKKFTKRTMASVIVGLICICAAFGQTPVDLDAAIQQAGREIGGRLKPIGLITTPRVVLLNFSSGTNDFSAYVLKEMALALEKNRNSAVIARAEIDRALASANLRITGEVTDAAAQQIGKTLTAQYVVTGSFEKAGNDYRFRTRVITINDTSSPPTSTISVRETPQVRQLLGIPEPVLAAPVPAPVPAPAPAPAAPPPAAPAPAAPPPAPAPSPGVAPPTPAPAPEIPAPAPALTPAAPAAVSYKVGDTGPAGGLIFYDKGNNANGWRYLEAAPADVDPKLKAVSENINRSNSNERAVGRGASNTREIMKEANNKGGGFGWAAQACDVFSLNGFSDWFLPSRDELHYMYGNLHMKKLGEFRNEWYWSSTGSGSGSGSSFWAENFSGGKQDGFTGSYYEYRVRPVRQVPGPN